MLPSHRRQQLILRLLKDIGITSQDDLSQIPWDQIDIGDGVAVCLMCNKEFSARSHLTSRQHRNQFYWWEIDKLASESPQVTMATFAAAVAAAARAPHHHPRSDHGHSPTAGAA